MIKRTKTDGPEVIRVQFNATGTQVVQLYNCTVPSHLARDGIRNVPFTFLSGVVVVIFPKSAGRTGTCFYV
eukprot:scaffold4059_cov52-Attheya_sp.AAC.2